MDHFHGATPILDDEWPEVRRKMEDWLSAENFDAAGNAKTSLSEAMQVRSVSRRGVPEPE